MRISPRTEDDAAHHQHHPDVSKQGGFIYITDKDQGLWILRHSGPGPPPGSR